MPKSREGEPSESQILRVAGLSLDVGVRQVTVRGETHRLTPKECRLLEVFMRNPGRVLTRKFLMKEVWETSYLGDTRTLDVHVCWLRRKIEEDPRNPVLLRTLRGAGYRFGGSE